MFCNSLQHMSFEFEWAKSCDFSHGSTQVFNSLDIGVYSSQCRNKISCTFQKSPSKTYQKVNADYFMGYRMFYWNPSTFKNVTQHRIQWFFLSSSDPKMICLTRLQVSWKAVQAEYVAFIWGAKIICRGAERGGGMHGNALVAFGDQHVTIFVKNI